MYVSLFNVWSSMCVSLRQDTLSIASVFAQVFHMTVGECELMSNYTLATANRTGLSEIHQCIREPRRVPAVDAVIQPMLRNVHVTLLLPHHTDLQDSTLCKTSLPHAHWPHVVQCCSYNRAQRNMHASDPETTSVKLCHYWSHYYTENQKLL